MTRVGRYRALLGGLALSGACSGCAEATGSGASSSGIEAAIVYGEDDRHEARSYGDDVFADLALSSVGALVNERHLRWKEGQWVVEGPALGERARLCAGEPLLSQPSVADCTAALIEPRVIVTAGHCVNDSTLDDFVFVRDYALGGDFPNIGAGDVYSLDRVLLHRDGNLETATGDDFALLRLRVPAAGSPLKLPAEEPAVAEGDPVVVIGTSEGLPLKIDDGGEVLDAAPRDYFKVTSDTFAGGSGSPVFDTNANFLGIIVGGSVDYSWDEAGSCLRRNRATSPETGGELVVRISAVARALGETRRRNAPGCRQARGAAGTFDAWPVGWLIVALIRRAKRRPAALRGS